MYRINYQSFQFKLVPNSSKGWILLSCQLGQIFFISFPTTKNLTSTQNFQALSTIKLTTWLIIRTNLNHMIHAKWHDSDIKSHWWSSSNRLLDVSSKLRMPICCLCKIHHWTFSFISWQMNPLNSIEVEEERICVMLVIEN